MDEQAQMRAIVRRRLPHPAFHPAGTYCPASRQRSHPGQIDRIAQAPAGHPQLATHRACREFVASEARQPAWQSGAR